MTALIHPKEPTLIRSILLGLCRNLKIPMIVKPTKTTHREEDGEGGDRENPNVRMLLPGLMSSSNLPRTNR